MRRSHWLGIVSASAFCGVLIGCGGAGGSDLVGGGPPPDGGGGGGDALAEQGTARIDIDAASGQVKITPLGMAPGSNQSKSLYAGSALSLSSSSLITDPGELTLRRIRLTIKNNTGDSISDGRLIVDRVITSGESVDLRQFSSVSTIVGPGSSVNDGPGPSVTIASPTGVARDLDGTLYIAGSGDGSLRRLRDGYVTRLATGLTSPGGVGISGSFAFLVEQTAHNLVRVPTSGGNKFVMAGNGTAGLVDGAGAAARFNSPRDIEIVGTTAFISDNLNDRIRTATNLSGGSATVATLNVFPVIPRPSGLGSFTNSGVNWLVVTSTQTHRIYLVNSANGQSFSIAGTGASGGVDGSGSTATFNTPFDATVVGETIFVTDLGGRTIRQLSLTSGAAPQFAASWQVDTIAGAGTSGAADGSGVTAQLASPRFIDGDGSGALVLADMTNNRIRKVSAGSGTFPISGTGGAGSGLVTVTGSDGYLPETAAASFRRPYFDLGSVFPNPIGVQQDVNFAIEGAVQKFTIYVSVVGSAPGTPALLDAVKNVSGPFVGSPNVNVRTIAGLSDQAGWIDGPGNTARFGTDVSIAKSDVGIFVADYSNATIRFIDPAGTVSTIIGMKGITNGMPTAGTGATCVLRNPIGITSNRDGTILYVVDFFGSVLYRMSRSGDVKNPHGWTVGIVAGAPNVSGNARGTGAETRFALPIGVAASEDGNAVFVADRGNHNIIRLSFGGSNPNDAGQWTSDLYAGSSAGTSGFADGNGIAARFSQPNDVALHANGDLFVAEYNQGRVRRITPSGDVTLLAGSSTGTTGLVDGIGSAARFELSYRVATDNGGYVYVADGTYLRRISIATGEVRTVAGNPSATVVDGPGNTSVGRFEVLFYDPDDGLYVDTSGSVRLVERIVRNGQP